MLSKQCAKSIVCHKYGWAGPVFGQTGFFSKFANKVPVHNRSRDHNATETACLLGVLAESDGGLENVCLRLH